MTDKIIIADTSCLIAFDRINKLDILQKTFSEIVTTKEVAEEFGKNIPHWLLISQIKNIRKKEELEKIVDSGEASAIALAIETKNSVLIIDERKGRKLAIDLHIEIIGTLRVILIAKQKGVIRSVKEIIQQFEQANFRFSRTIAKEILKIAGES